MIDPVEGSISNRPRAETIKIPAHLHVSIGQVNEGEIILANQDAQRLAGELNNLIAFMAQ